MAFDFDLMNDIYPPEVNYFKFPDGQPHFEGFSHLPNRVKVLSRLSNGEDIYKLLVFLDYLERNCAESVTLYLSYVSGARMDRVINGGALTPVVIGNILKNSPVKIAETHILDPHSDVITSHLPNGVAWSRDNILLNAIRSDEQIPLLVAPDIGAHKKVENAAFKYSLDCDFATKNRDPNNGKLLSCSIGHPGKIVKANRILIVDDICDGGGTFELLAAKIKEWNDCPIHLFVTHGIFSGKNGHQLDGIDYIYTTDSFAPHESDEHMKVFKLRETLWF